MHPDSVGEPHISRTQDIMNFIDRYKAEKSLNSQNAGGITMKELTKHIIKFGVLATTGIGLGMMLSKKKGDEEINTVESEDNKGEDSYNPGWSKNRILSNKRFNSRYENDLKRWGTKQGVIDVSNDEGAEKKKHKLASQMGRVGNELVKDHLAELLVKTRPKKSLTPLQDYYTWLQKEYSITQVTIRNTSATERLIRLWGANKGGAISPTLPSDVEDHTIIRQVTVPVSTGMAIHPIEAAHNPANGYTYVTNQLSNNVTVLNDQGDIVRLIQLEPNALPGSNSPVGIAINTKPSSPNYGRAYVAGSVANTLSIIDLSFNVVDEIAVGNRPIGVAYNPYNDRLYVTNHVDDSLSVIQADTEILLFTAPTGNNPRGVGVSAANGTTYVANQGGDDVWIYDIASQFAISIAVGNSPTYVTHHPPSGEMLVVNSGSNDITPIDPILYQPLPSFGVGNNPSNLAFNPANNFMYVGNRADNTFTILSPDKSIRATLNLGNVNVGFAFNATGEVLFVSGYRNKHGKCDRLFR